MFSRVFRDKKVYHWPEKASTLIFVCEVRVVLQERANCGSPSSTSTLGLDPEQHNQGLEYCDQSELDLWGR
jgi:hypothetical protein